jgi:dienelactone hydrolase
VALLAPAIVAQSSQRVAGVTIEPIAPVAVDGHRGRGYLLQPTGSGGLRPAVLLLHPGNVELPDASLRNYASTAELPRAFANAGYVVAVTTYRSRDVDPQAPDARNDSLAALEYLSRLPDVDGSKLAVFGCSNGGDLALEVGIASDVAAIVAEEPATAMFAGMLTRRPSGERIVPGADGGLMLRNPDKFFTPELQAFTRAKVARLRAPILMLQGEPTRPLNGFNAAILLPELRAAAKPVTVLSYPKEPHCFVWGPMEGVGPPSGAAVQKRTPETARRAVEDTLAFLRQRFEASSPARK